MTGALIDWTSAYPGDLVDNVTRGYFQEILELLLKHTFMAHLTAQLATTADNLDNVVDVDRSWSLKPEALTTDPADISASIPSSTQTDLLVEGGRLYDYDSVQTRSEVDTPLTKGSTSSLQTGSTTSLGVEALYRRRSGSDSRLIIGSDHSLSRRRSEEGYSKWSGAFHYVLTVEPRNFAIELTRMQWQLFAALRVGFSASAGT